jgi:hypothetical protein
VGARISQGAKKTPAHIQVKTGGEKRATKIWLCLKREMKPTPISRLEAKSKTPGARQTEEIEPRARTEKRAGGDEDTFEHKKKISDLGLTQNKM